ncbi:MAG: DUF5009 domain-containing protein [Verrucomicrobiota bacterium]
MLSLDALRGFDMFWIIGAEDIVQGLHHASQAGLAVFLAGQLTHRKWEGVTFYDLIFPLFVFIVGVSLVFSLSREVARDGKVAAYKRVLRRSVLLYLFGIFAYGGLSQGFEQVRLLGVLQRIALCYLFASFLFLNFKRTGLILWCAGLLLGYWALMCFVPVPEVGAGNLEEGKNLANYIDKMYLPGRKWDGDHDPEGLLSTLPAIATCLLGVFAGMLLQSATVTDRKKVQWLLGAGILAVSAGFVWGMQFPIIKKLWTSSYVLVAGGYSALFLAGFYWVIEICRMQKWAIPFVWIGTNAIAIYMAHHIVSFSKIAERIVGGPVRAAVEPFGEFLIAATVLAMSFLFVRFLYQRKIFLRL